MGVHTALWSNSPTPIAHRLSSLHTITSVKLLRKKSKIRLDLLKFIVHYIVKNSRILTAESVKDTEIVEIFNSNRFEFYLTISKHTYFRIQLTVYSYHPQHASTAHKQAHVHINIK